ncbi:pyrimidine-nucleoside phosphorylase [Desulforamulus ruminis]|uniref:Pyrimidine-nucleoside phosphorylase n=1 Tax=Desulforamulus ruminis (strain ATCC 23193 / DSM 2154 / NCIMB 8452 / DL) TaxID=696281 RepID=F6DTR7_DESRL|nr:pyrimidine-nucleoside phosphorylase [Desulforamulus ruminis]AEG61241.1 pyrimidine-nucleoside phosphorylase [Desulforamulus ruminis DSM 2154]
MRMYDIILKKRRGGTLSAAEIDFFIQGYTRGDVPDYQAAALTMAIFFQGLEPEETADLTLAMARSGDRADLSSLPGVKVDKHSTGGVGDKTTLVLGPLVAAAGVPVAKMSGRGLGHTGGTIDKLEAIPGFRVSMDNRSFLEQVRRINLAVVAQTGHLAPADKKLYALRDVTATVDSIPLIAASVMSKKIAAGADAIVLDVKVGSGAFMKKLEDAFNLARTMVDIGNQVGRKTVALVTNMDQPLGYAVGNALEVREAIATLKGQGPEDLRELCLQLGSEMLVLAGMAEDPPAARTRLEQIIDSGAALNKFKEFVAAQGGNPEVADREELLPAAAVLYPVQAKLDGYIAEIQAEQIGLAAMALGAGRATKEDVIDLAVGIVLKKKIGDKISAGETLADLHAQKDMDLTAVEQMIQQAFTINGAPPAQGNILLGKVSGSSVFQFE